jgi:hypothetical protein
MAAANEGKILVVADVAELAHKPAPARSPADHHPVTASLKARIKGCKRSWRLVRSHERVFGDFCRPSVPLMVAASVAVAIIYLLQGASAYHAEGRGFEPRRSASK